ncbi:MAG: hypothetical protein O7G31_16030 [Calditrichaeota bacterium]|nr:hypothetical protein [Calditrichota bacterium]
MNQPTQMSESDRLSLVVEIWKKTVEVQQHFNDIELRIRNIAVTVLVGAFGAVAFSMKEALTITFFGIEVLAGKLIIIAALIAWLAFYFMDRFWYHRLLKGAVNLGIKIEKANRHLLPEIDLSSEIAQTSPVDVFGYTLHSDRKMDLFYLTFALILIVAAFALGGPPTRPVVGPIF